MAVKFNPFTGNLDLIDTTAAAGSTTQIQYNNAGLLAGVSTMTFDGTSVTLAGRLINSYSGTASSPAKVFTGAWFTGGTSTTTKPQLLIEPSGATSTGWSTSGTGLGVNAASGFTGRLLDLQLNGTSQMVVQGDGKLLVGTSTSRSNGGVQSQLQVENTNYAGLSLVTNNATGNVCPLILMGRSRGTALGSSTIVVNGDRLAGIFAQGADGTDIETPAASIEVFVDGTPGANDMPGRLVFSTTADGASSPTERLRITSNAYVRLASGTGGIQFNGDTAAANALDDYEEGTWTPTIADGTNSATLTTAVGTYTKVGRQVTASCYLVVNSIGSVGGARVGGLPFAIASGNQFGGSVAVGYGASLNITAGQALTGRFYTGNSSIFLSIWSSTGGTADMLGSQISDGGELVLTFTYFT